MTTPTNSKGIYETVHERSFDRAVDEMRPVKITRGFTTNAPGSCLVEFGNTKVICTASIEEKVPQWRKGRGAGWVTAEYSMLPGSTARRTARETNGQKGRTQEIQRLIGRSLRNVCDMNALGGEITVTLDCDVIQADGGTRTASITGAWVALHDAMEYWKRAGRITKSPLTGQVVAISVGMVDGRLLLDLDYPEDSHAEVDMNVVANSHGDYIEVQGTGEQAPFSRDRLNGLLDLADKGIRELLRLQRAVIAE